MKILSLSCVLLVLTACSAYTAIQEPAQPLDAPTQEVTIIHTSTSTPTLTPTQTLTPTTMPTPEGQTVSESLLRFSFFGPADHEIISGIYRQYYSFAAIYQKTTHWDKAIILIDVDISNQGNLPIELVLSTLLVNLDYFNATVEETGEFSSLTINDYEAIAVDFTGETIGYPIQGRSVVFQPDENHIFVGISWNDISTDTDIWANQGIHLFDYVIHSVSFEP
jgi:hypothetical protein